MRRHQPWLVVVLVGAVVGVVFAAVSTYDFVQHLDRQVHNLHCSFIPGVSHGAGESGCQVAMMSPYSSVLRAQVWGGIPISLAAMSVFAFLAFYVLDLMVTRRRDDPRATGFLALATLLPALTSAVMLAISLAKLGTTCKLCVCIYLASAACLIGGLVVWRGAVRARRGGAAPEPEVHRRDRHHDEPAFVGRARAQSSARLVAVGVDTGAVSGGFLAGMFAIGVAFVAIPVALYAAMAPDHARFIGTCEALAHPDDVYGVMVRVERPGGSGVKRVPAIEVLDPLCPACRAFEDRLAASGLDEQLDRKAVLFPLDKPCNWMVTEATHPGACTVSEAVLCAGDKSPEVIAWAFENQDRIRDAARTDADAAARIVKQRFPQLASCVGSPEARSRLNKSMRWIVANNIRVLTPQVFIDNVKLCDEDVDLGLEYTLSNMLERHAKGTLAAVPLEKPQPRTPGDKGAPDKPTTDNAASNRPSDKAPADNSPADKASGANVAGDSAAADKAASDKAPAGSNKTPSGDSGSDKPSSETSPADKAASDKAAPDKAAPDKAAPDKAAPDKAPSDKPASDKMSSDKAAPAKAPPDNSASDKAASDKAASDKTSSDKAASDKTSSDKTSSDKTSSDKTSSDKAAPAKAPSDKAASEKAASDKAASDKAAPAKAPSDKAASEKAASDKTSSDKTSSDKTSSDKAAPDKAPSDKAASDKIPNKVPARAPHRAPSSKAPRKPAPDKAPEAPSSGPVTHPGDSP